MVQSRILEVSQEPSHVLDPLLEHYILLITEPSLQPQNCNFYFNLTEEIKLF